MSDMPGYTSIVIEIQSSRPEQDLKKLEEIKGKLVKVYVKKTW